MVHEGGRLLLERQRPLAVGQVHGEGRAVQAHQLLPVQRALGYRRLARLRYLHPGRNARSVGGNPPDVAVAGEDLAQIRPR